MIISEKQIFGLMTIARSYKDFIKERNFTNKNHVTNFIHELLFRIEEQQSEELKIIE